jgi:Tfp pilus assembly protein PilF
MKNLINSALLILAIAVTVAAQAVGSSRGLSTGEGSNTIQGRVYFPAGEENKGKSVRLHLESDTQVAGQSVVTDQDGAFRFNSLVPGNYTVVVDGKEYENTREPVSLDRSTGRTTQVNIQLRPKIDASNAAFAGVPKPALEAYQKGAAAAQKGNSKDAIQFLAKAVEAYPNFSQALSDLGSQYIKQSQWDKAVETYDSLLKLKPNDAMAHLDMGIVTYNQGIALSKAKPEESGQKLALAETHLREALKLKSVGYSAHYYLGLTLVKLRHYDEAQVEMEAAIKNGGDNIAMAHRALGGLYMNAHRNKEAADELEKFLQLDPKAPDAEIIKGSIKQLRGQ